MDDKSVAGARKKILVVDDNIVIVKSLAAKLAANGYEVLTALDGSEAVAAVRREKPDLILLDLNFPADVGSGGSVPWDGFLIIDWLRRMDVGQQTPFFVITGSDPAESDQRALAAGALKVFHKPIDREALVVAIRETLG